MEKDWYMCRPGIFISVVLGIAGLIACLLGTGMAFFIGAILLDLALVLPMFSITYPVIVNERKDQTLSFVMSLPIGKREYAVSKILLSTSCYF